MSISNLTAGSYSVTVTDANGCEDDCGVTVTTTECCNITDGGEIAFDQESCGPLDVAESDECEQIHREDQEILEIVWLSGSMWNPSWFMDSYCWSYWVDV